MGSSGDEFKTKDSGERVQWSTGMQRDTTKGKALWSLLIPALIPFKETMLYRWVMLLTRGAEKYEARNWEQARTGEELDRFKDSAFRHFMQWYCGDRDEDHAAAVFFNINGAEYVQSRMKNMTVGEVASITRDAAKKAGLNVEDLQRKANSTIRPTVPTIRQSLGLSEPYEGEVVRDVVNGESVYRTQTPTHRPLSEDEKATVLTTCDCEQCRAEKEALANRVQMPLPVKSLLTENRGQPFLLPPGGDDLTIFLFDTPDED